MKRHKLIQSNTVPDTFLAFTGGQLSYLRDKGLEIIAITSPGDKCEEFRRREQVQVYPVVMARDITNPFRDLSALLQIIRIMLKERPALVQGSTAKAGFLTMLAAAITRRPARIFFMRGIRLATLTGWKRIIIYYVVKLTCLLAHQVLCISSSVRSEALEIGIAAPEKTGLFHNGSSNGVDCDRFDPQRFEASAVKAEWGIADEAKVLLFVGRVVMDKGVVELAECWRRLKEKHTDIYLIMAGAVEKHNPPPQEVLDYLKAEDRVILPGHVNDIVPLYAMADLVVVPTYREGFGNFNLEAAAMEVPVVTTRVTGCLDAVVDGETGILVPPRDPVALVEAIEHLLEHPEVRERMGKAGRERAKRDFRPEEVWEALYREYVKLLIVRGIISDESEMMVRRKDENVEAATFRD